MKRWVRLTATGLVSGKPGTLEGFFVSSCLNGSITLYDGDVPIAGPV